MIGKEDIERLALLSRIKLEEWEVGHLAGEIDSILGYVDQVRAAGSSEDAAGETAGVRNVLREDANPHAPEAYTEDLLREMPAKEDGFLKVKKIL